MPESLGFILLKSQHFIISELGTEKTKKRGQNGPGCCARERKALSLRDRPRSNLGVRAHFHSVEDVGVQMSSVQLVQSCCFRWEDEQGQGPSRGRVVQRNKGGRRLLEIGSCWATEIKKG
jgi:hypothetical protein